MKTLINKHFESPLMAALCLVYGSGAIAAISFMLIKIIPGIINFLLSIRWFG